MPNQAAEPAPPPATARQSDPDLESVVQEHLHALWRYLRMHGASAHEADDLAQEAFVIALQKGAAFLAPAATATFLRRTARFLFLRLRSGGLDETLLADAVDQLWDRTCDRDGGDVRLDALRACLAELTDRARRAVELSYGLDAFDARSRVAIAAELGMQENGVKTLMQRVRQQLRACVERRVP